MARTHQSNFKKKKNWETMSFFPMTMNVICQSRKTRGPVIFRLVKTDPQSLTSGTIHVSIRLFNQTFFIVLAVPEILRYTQSYFAKYVRKPFHYSSCFRKVRGSGKIPGKVSWVVSAPILRFFPLKLGFLSEEKS